MRLRNKNTKVKLKTKEEFKKLIISNIIIIIMLYV